MLNQIRGHHHIIIHIKIVQFTMRLPSLSPPTPSPLSLLFPFPPLEVGPLNPARGSGGPGGKLPQPKLNLVHFGLKI